MKKNIYYLSVLFLAGCVAGGCSDEQGNTVNIPATSGEPIRFSVSTDNVKSRTVYDELEEDGWTLDWVTGDEIGIYTTAEDKYVVKWNSGGTPVNDGSKYAVYYINEVNPQGHQHEGTIYWNGDHLVWGESVSEENPWLTFYGAYPAEEVIGTNYPYDGSEGIIQMDYHTNQLAVINKKEGDTYVAPPDMKEAYMIAKRNIQPSGEHILLDFDPIMTTLNLNITAGGYEEKTGIINPVTITGVSVTMPHGINNGEFKYDTDGMENDGTHGKLADGVQSDYKEPVFVGIQNGLDNNKRYIDLFEGESVNLFAFLPPVDMTKGATIKVHTTGALNFVLDITKEMIQQSRIDIQLPDVSPESENELMVNNWISQLDPSIKLDQLSIPGYICTGNETSHDIQTLLRQGVRAFNIEKLTTHDGNNYNIDDANINNILKTFMSTTDEFLILWIENGHTMNTANHRINEYLDQTFGNENEKWFSTENVHNLSINDLRGKVLAIKQNFYGTYTYFTPESQAPAKLTNRIILFDYQDIESVGNFAFNLFGEAWMAQFINDESFNKSIYETILSSEKGCTGIITIPNAGSILNYGDLLLQSIIDCNYKFILDRN